MALNYDRARQFLNSAGKGDFAAIRRLLAAFVDGENPSASAAGQNALASPKATATAGAATLNTVIGTVTSEALTTAAGATYALTLTNNKITAESIVQATLSDGTNTTVGPVLLKAQPAAGSCVFIVKNTHSANALNGTIRVNYETIQA